MGWFKLIRQNILKRLVGIVTKGASETRVKKSEKKKSSDELLVKDTDFILKLFMRSDFTGTELEQAHSTLSKVASKHQRNLGNAE